MHGPFVSRRYARPLVVMAVLALVAALVPVMPAAGVTGQPVITMDEVWVDASVDGPGSGTQADPFRLITDGLAHAAEGAVVHVAAGEYGPDDGETLPLAVPSGVTVQGEYDPEDGWGTVLYGEYDGYAPIMLVEDAEGVVIKDLQFMENVNGTYWNVEVDVPYMSAGIEIEASQVDVLNCGFGWLLGYEGSAILANESDVTLTGCVFAYNGVFMPPHAEVPEEYADELKSLEKLSPDDSPVTLQNGMPECMYGGAVLGLWSDLRVTNSVFAFNAAYQAGGALLGAYGWTSTEGCIFYSNMAQDGFDGESVRDSAATYSATQEGPFGGGAVNNYIGYYDSFDTIFLSNDCWAGAALMSDTGSATLTRNELVDNDGDNIVALDYSVETDSIAPPSAQELFSLETPEEPETPDVEIGLDIDASVLAYGWGEYMVYAGVRPARITNSLFNDNECGSLLAFESMGPGAVLPDPEYDPDWASSVEGCTITQNWADYGIVNGDWMQSTSLVNSIIWDNSVEGPVAEDVDAWNNDIDGDYYDDIDDNLSVDPEFVDPDVDDFHLAPSSPCIDSGTGAAPAESDIPFDPRPWDLDFTLRPTDGDETDGPEYDMGAFEYLPPGRLGGENRYETAIETSQQFFGRADTVVLATGRAFADGLAGSGLAGMYRAPLLLTNGVTLLPAVADEIERLSASRVFILGGPEAIAPAVEEALWDMGLDVVRIGGIDRYETAALIAEHMITGGALFMDEGKAFVARGDLFPDALAAAPIAYANHMPVLLVHPDQLPEHTVDILNLYGVTGAVVIGGDAAVSASVADELATLADDVTRVSGANRYETAANLAEWAWDEAYAGFWVSGVATGDDFADALSGGAGIGSQNGVLLLTPYDSVAPACEDAVVDHALEIATLQTFGGMSAISDDVYDYLMELLD